MDQQDITYYLVADKSPGFTKVQDIINLCEAVDISGSDKEVFYNGIEGFDETVEYDFEVKPPNALEKCEKFVHTNFTLLEWHNDELLKEIAELLEEVNEKSAFKVDSISLLWGPHEILALEDKLIVKSEFSLAFYSESPLKENAEDVNLRLAKDRDLSEKISILEQICGSSLKGFLGGS